MATPENSEQPDEVDSLGSLRASLPGVVAFGIGLAIWFITAGLLFFIALPLLALGTFLLLFSALTAKHSSRGAKLLAFLLPGIAAFITASLLWPAAFSA